MAGAVCFRSAFLGGKRGYKKPFVADLEALRRGFCDDAKQAKCLDEFGPELIGWTCSQCEEKKADSISEYTGKMFRIRHLQKAGYPFKANDLSLKEWEDLGLIVEFENGNTANKDRTAS